LALMLLGVALLVIDVHVTTHGALTVAGLISLAVGSIMLFQNAPGFHTSKPLVIGIAVVLGATWAFALSKAVEVRRRPVEVGSQLIAGSVGEVRGNGLVFVNGELWEARTPSGEQLRPGQRVRVESLDGLVLTVRPEGT
jgi:membrane-bound serine protease (ClpP class)